MSSVFFKHKGKSIRELIRDRLTGKPYVRGNGIDAPKINAGNQVQMIAKQVIAERTWTNTTKANTKEQILNVNSSERERALAAKAHTPTERVSEPRKVKFKVPTSIAKLAK